MNLYNIRSRDGVFIITKFDTDLNIVDDSIYEVSMSDTGGECTCPAGSRSSCRHRQMLPIFLAEDRIDSDWFYCFETFAWSQPFEPMEDIEPTVEEIAEAAESATPYVNDPVATTAGPLGSSSPSAQPKPLRRL